MALARSLGLRQWALLSVPLVGCALTALTARSDRLYLLLVQEDALLEWAQVLEQEMG